MPALLILLLAALAPAQTRPAVSAEVGGANLPAQKIGANDLIAIAVYDAPEFTRTVRVGPDGQIRLPMLKRPVQAAGRLPAELEAAVAEALKAELILVDPVVTITMVEYHSRPISVAGAVKSPVTFQAVGSVSLLEALTRAGGLSEEAGPEILVTRIQAGEGGAPPAITQRVAVSGLLESADPEANLRLHGGEEVRVPAVGKVFVVGNVKRPGAYAVQEASETTLLRMLALAEGLAPYASKQAYIIRRDDRTGARHEIPIELKKIMERRAPDVPLVAGDILYVPDNSGRRTTVNAIDRAAAFGAATLSGLLIWRR